MLVVDVISPKQRKFAHFVVFYTHNFHVAREKERIKEYRNGMHVRGAQETMKFVNACTPSSVQYRTNSRQHFYSDASYSSGDNGGDGGPHLLSVLLNSLCIQLCQHLRMDAFMCIAEYDCRSISLFLAFYAFSLIKNKIQFCIKSKMLVEIVMWRRRRLTEDFLHRNTYIVRQLHNYPVYTHPRGKINYAIFT